MSVALSVELLLNAVSRSGCSSQVVAHTYVRFGGGNDERARLERQSASMFAARLVIDGEDVGSSCYWYLFTRDRDAESTCSMQQAVPNAWRRLFMQPTSCGARRGAARGCRARSSAGTRCGHSNTARMLQAKHHDPSKGTD